MLAMGRASMSVPLVLDEPSMGLAPLLIEEIFQIIRQLMMQEPLILLVENAIDGNLRLLTVHIVPSFLVRLRWHLPEPTTMTFVRLTSAITATQWQMCFDCHRILPARLLHKVEPGFVVMFEHLPGKAHHI